MVKGVSKQVIVVHAPDEKIFEQAIFILKENAVDGGGVTDEALLKEARRLIGAGNRRKKSLWLPGAVWAFGGALVTGVAWLVSALF